MTAPLPIDPPRTEPIDPDLSRIMYRKFMVQAAKKQREATAHRDVVVTALRHLGVPLREVAELAGLSHTAVSKIAARTDVCAECLFPGGERTRSFQFHAEWCPTQQG